MIIPILSADLSIDSGTDSKTIIAIPTQNLSLDVVTKNEDVVTRTPLQTGEVIKCNNATTLCSRYLTRVNSGRCPSATVVETSESGAIATIGAIQGYV